jgi:hypothetical protein
MLPADQVHAIKLTSKQRPAECKGLRIAAEGQEFLCSAVCKIKCLTNPKLLKQMAAKTLSAERVYVVCVDCGDSA